MKKNLKIYLASPRGFCAGVKRAIDIVEKSLEKYGKPVYVRHEIVHNKQVVETLKKKGAIFVEELSDIKDNSRPATILKRVDLPQPEGPTNTTNSPSSMSISRPWITSVFPYDLNKSRIFTSAIKIIL